MILDEGALTDHLGVTRGTHKMWLCQIGRALSKANARLDLFN